MGGSLFAGVQQQRARRDSRRSHPRRTRQATLHGPVLGILVGRWPIAHRQHLRRLVARVDARDSAAGRCGRAGRARFRAEPARKPVDDIRDDHHRTRQRRDRLRSVDVRVRENRAQAESVSRAAPLTAACRLHIPSTIARHTAFMEAVQMDHYGRRYRWIAFLFALFVAAAVGYVAYSAGVAHGIAAAGQQIAAPATGAAPFAPYPYGWYRPWGFGFGFFFVPFFFFLAFIFVMRAL